MDKAQGSVKLPYTLSAATIAINYLCIYRIPSLLPFTPVIFEMDSQVTLVGNSPPLSILFDSYSVRNARVSLSTAPSKILYTIHTASPKPAADTASYIRAGDRTVTAIQQNEVLPDKITFHEEDGTKRKVSANKWLKKGTLPDHW